MRQDDQQIVFDYNDLLIDLSKLDHNLHAFKTEKEEIEKSHPDDYINDSILERARRFNESTYYLMDSIYNFFIASQYYGDKETSEKIIRRSLRNICINVEIYFEKILAILRYFFSIDLNLKKRGEIIKKIKEFCPISVEIEELVKKIDLVIENKDFKIISKIRNDEIHNESVFEYHNYKLEKENDNLKIINLGYKYSNEYIQEKIFISIFLLINLKFQMEKVIKISPWKINNFINNNPQISKINKLKDRVDIYKENENIWQEMENY